MTTSVTSHSSSVHVARIGTLTSLPMSMDSSGMSPNTTTSLPSSPVSVTAMSGLLSSRNLVQDEKLVVATLATLNSGSASSLIKQDLKWIIQSRRKAEGKAELQVEFKKPVKDEQLTSEEVMKRARRRELNRLAARRSREKGQKRKDLLVEEIRKLQSENSELVSILGDLTVERDHIVLILRQHMKQCSDYNATQSAAIGVSQKVLDLLGFPLLSAGEAQVQGVSDLYINTGDSSSSHSQSQSPSVVVKQENCDFSSCSVSPLMVGDSNQLMEVKETSMPGGSIIYDESSSFTSHNIFNLQSPQSRYSFPLGNLQFDSPPLSCAVPILPPPPPPPPPPPRSCSQDPEATSCTMDTADKQEVIHYKHKLMKHRKHFSQTSQSSFAGSRSNRASLERSFSFPCTVKESRSNFNSPAVSESYKLEPCQPETMTLTHNPLASPALITDMKDQAVGYPLDLAVKKSPGPSDNNQEKMFTVSPMDTWPPAGMRAMPFRNLERRWSVDHSLPEPLNLSSKVRSEVMGHHLTEMTPGSNPSQQRRDNRHSEFGVDTYR